MLFFISEERRKPVRKRTDLAKVKQTALALLSAEINKTPYSPVIVDDSVLCTNPDDGITYKILLNDLHISHYTESGVI